MTQRESIKLAKLGQKVDDQGGDISEIKSDIKEIKTMLYAQHGSFITKKAAAWLTTAMIALGAALGSIVTAFRTH